MMPMVDLSEVAAASVAGLGPRGERFPVFVTPPEGAEVVLARDVIARGTLPGFFQRVLSDWSIAPDTAELMAAAASRFLRRYCGSVTAAALIPLTNGVAVDVGLSHVSLIFRDDQAAGAVIDVGDGTVATTSERPPLWPVTGERLPTVEALRQRALQSLFEENLVPALGRVHEETHLARRLMWATVAEQIDALYETGLRFADDDRRATLTEDRDAIFTAERLPGVDGPNPLVDMLDWDQPGHPRRYCCVCYVIPGRKGDGQDTHCEGCPMLASGP
jgi:ferric iron reductase protein FhuF